MKTMYFLSGNPIFMGIITIVLIIMVVWCIYHIIPVLKNAKDEFSRLKNKIGHIKSIGLFALITGVLCQLINLYSIMYEIEQAGDITPGLVTSALKISMIPLLYGVSVYLFSLILWIMSDLLLKAKMSD